MAYLIIPSSWVTDITFYFKLFLRDLNLNLTLSFFPVTFFYIKNSKLLHKFKLQTLIIMWDLHRKFYLNNDCLILIGCFYQKKKKKKKKNIVLQPLCRFLLFITIQYQRKKVVGK